MPPEVMTTQKHKGDYQNLPKKLKLAINKDSLQKSGEAVAIKRK